MVEKSRPKNWVKEAIQEYDKIGEFD